MRWIAFRAEYLRAMPYSMPADGFTKILSQQKFIDFIRQLGLNDITERPKGLRQSAGNDLDAIHIR